MKLKTKSAKEIVELLRARHSEDIFVSECKNGPTHSGEHLRLDGWAMKRSWSNPLVIGYEVKVNRSDFVRDTKWHAYLPLCNCLYFVTPPDLIKESEVPEMCGLLIAHSTRLVTKKLAPYREVSIPESLYRYILMARSRIGDEITDFDRTAMHVRQWKEWLQQKEENQELGHRVAYRIREMVDEAKRRLERAQELEASNLIACRALALLGINHWDQVPERIEEAMKRKAEELDKLVPDDFVKGIEKLNKEAEALLKRVRPMKEAA